MGVCVFALQEAAELLNLAFALLGCQGFANDSGQLCLAGGDDAIDEGGEREQVAQVVTSRRFGTELLQGVKYGTIAIEIVVRGGHRDGLVTGTAIAPHLFRPPFPFDFRCVLRERTHGTYIARRKHPIQ